jgi:hypothetical protein
MTTIKSVTSEMLSRVMDRIHAMALEENAARDAEDNDREARAHLESQICGSDVDAGKMGGGA